MNAAGWYSPVASPPDLERVLACAWTAVPSGVHRLTPDVCVDVLRVSDGALVLCGPERRSWRFRLPDEVTAVGVRFRPGVAGAVFGLDVSTITDRRVPLAEVIGHQRVRAASRRIGALVPLDQQRDALVDEVRGWVHGVRLDPRVDTILDRLLARPGIGQHELAQAVGMSVRSLHRLATRCFGFGTATVARIVRLQRLLAIAVLDHGAPLAVLAAEAGYTDQAHLSTDCRAITGLTPTSFLAEWFPTFPDVADPYKTGEPLVATIES